MKNSLPVLYSFRRCPYAIRSRMALRYSNIHVEHREVELKSKPLSMLNYSRKGTVPVLVLQDGTVIDESREIITWALKINDPDNWKASGLPLRDGLSKVDTSINDKMEMLVEKNDNYFKQYLDKYKYSDRYPENTQEFYRHKAEEFLIELENHLSNNLFLFSPKISVADISIFPFIRQFAFVDKVWFDQSKYKYLKIWLEVFLTSDLFNAVMEKHKPFEE